MGSSRRAGILICLLVGCGGGGAASTTERVAPNAPTGRPDPAPPATSFQKITLAMGGIEGQRTLTVAADGVATLAAETNMNDPGSMALGEFATTLSPDAMTSLRDLLARHPLASLTDHRPLVIDDLVTRVQLTPAEGSGPIERAYGTQRPVPADAAALIAAMRAIERDVLTHPVRAVRLEIGPVGVSQTGQLAVGVRFLSIGTQPVRFGDPARTMPASGTFATLSVWAPPADGPQTRLGEATDVRIIRGPNWQGASGAEVEIAPGTDAPFVVMGRIAGNVPPRVGLRLTFTGGGLGAPAPALQLRDVVVVIDPVTVSSGAPPVPGADERACRVAEDCVLVRGVCGEIESVNRAHGREVLTRNEAMAATARCLRAPQNTAVQPSCNRTCGTHRVPHPDVRACQRDSDCMPFDYGCQWTTVARASEQVARRLMPIGRVCPGILPAPPDVRCGYGFCTLAPNLP